MDLTFYLFESFIYMLGFFFSTNGPFLSSTSQLDKNAESKLT